MTGAGHPEAKAWHEAGHALVAHLAGGRIHELTLEGDDDALDGRVSIAWEGVHGRAVLAASARTALGGPLAELVFRGDGGLEDPATVSTWAADWAEVERCAAALEPDAARRVGLIRAWLDEVRRLFDDPRNEERLARIADALDAHGTLDEALFEEAVGPD